MEHIIEEKEVLRDLGVMMANDGNPLSNPKLTTVANFTFLPKLLTWRGLYLSSELLVRRFQP